MAAREDTPLLEWISAAMGAAITLALLGFIAVGAFTGSTHGPAVITVETTRTTATPGGHVVEISARNVSDRTAAGLRIEGRLTNGASLVETSETVIDYVPGRSVRKAALIFTQNPRRHRLEIRATGYEEP